MMQNRLQQLMQFLENNPSDAFIIFAIAKEYEKNGDMDQALTYYLRLITQHPDYVGVYYHLGKLYEKANKTEMALETYSKGMEIANIQKDRHAFNELRNAYDELAY